MISHYIIAPLANIPCIGKWVKRRGPFVKAYSIPVDHNRYPIAQEIRPLSQPIVNTPNNPLLAIPTCGKAIAPPVSINPRSFTAFFDHGSEIYTHELAGLPITITNEDHIIGTIAVHSFLVHLPLKETYWVQEIDGLTSNGLVKLSVRNEEGKMRKFYVPFHRMVIPWYWRWVRLRSWYHGHGYLDEESFKVRRISTTLPQFSDSSIIKAPV